MRRGLIAAAAVIALAATGCGSKDDTADTSGGLDPSGTGTAAGTGTGAATGPGTGTGAATGTGGGPGNARMVHLIADIDVVDIHLNDLPDPLLGDVPNRTNTDVGDGYAPFPAAVYDVSARDHSDGAEVARIDDARVVSEKFYTVIFYGTFADGTASGWGHEDSPGAAAAGEHGIEIFHFTSGVAAVDLWWGGAEQVTGLAFGESTGRVEVPSGTLELGVDVDGDDVADLTFNIPAADTGWSHAYIMPTVDMTGVEVLHHIPETAMTTISAN